MNSRNIGKPSLTLVAGTGDQGKMFLLEEEEMEVWGLGRWMVEELHFPSSPSQRIFPWHLFSRILLGGEWDSPFKDLYGCVCVRECVCLGLTAHLLPWQLLSLDMLKTLISGLSRSPQLSASVSILTLHILLVKLLQMSSLWPLWVQCHLIDSNRKFGGNNQLSKTEKEWEEKMVRTTTNGFLKIIFIEICLIYVC